MTPQPRANHRLVLLFVLLFVAFPLLLFSLLLEAFALLLLLFEIVVLLRFHPLAAMAAPVAAGIIDDTAADESVEIRPGPLPLALETGALDDPPPLYPVRISNVLLCVTTGAVPVSSAAIVTTS